MRALPPTLRAAIVAVPLTLLGCPQTEKPRPTPDPAPSGCKSDMDCKGNRVCTGGQCVDPPPERRAQPHPHPPPQPDGRPRPQPQPAPPPAPAARSRVPSEHEWRGVGEVTVSGSSRMNCETKKVREWVRVRCFGKNESGSIPRGVTVLHSSAPEAFTNAAGGEAVLVYPFTEGTNVEAIFRWSGRERRHFRAQWPAGSAEPIAKGEFLGVPPPTDPNRVWPCASDADCNSPFKCGRQGNCERM